MAEFRLIEESFEEIQDPDFYDKVAFVAHNCYQVPSKDHESNIAFIKRLIDSKHFAMIEHHRYVFEISFAFYQELLLLNNPFLTLVEEEIQGKKRCFLSCSLRPLLEADEKILPYAKRIASVLPDDTRELMTFEIPAKDTEIALINKLPEGISLAGHDALTFVTYKLITDRGVTHEIVRHRLCSFAQESTRYCNYTKDKFSNSLTFMKPLKYEECKETYDAFYQKCADTYFALINAGCRPDEARSVLPNSIKASIVVSCPMSEWKHIFDLRCDEHAHPDIRRLMIKVRQDMSEKGYLL